MNSDYPNFISGRSIKQDELQELYKNTEHKHKRKAILDSLRNLELQEQIDILRTELNEACENIKNLYEENRKLRSELDDLDSKIYDIQDEIR